MADKRIGQYFSGPLVAELLAFIIGRIGPDAHVIDPMVGRGDLLRTVADEGVPGSCLYGVDVDSEAIRECRKAVPGATVRVSDCFSCDLLDLYSSHQWDVVITNPPYVRREAIDEAYGVPRAAEVVRTNLSSLLGLLDASAAVRRAAAEYGGMADLAVPSWILCAALVRHGGTLAMVVPDAWMTRSYAGPVRRMLADEFDVSCVVKDASRSWFDDAQVKTDLLVAKRRHEGGSFRCVELGAGASGGGSLVGGLATVKASGYDVLADALASDETLRGRSLVASTLPTSVLTSDDTIATPSSEVSGMLASGVGIDAWGLRAGQGLRTGANGFFYFSRDADGLFRDDVMRETGTGDGLSADNPALVPALRRQSDVAPGTPFLASDAVSRILVLDGNLPDQRLSDAENACLLRLVRTCEAGPVGGGGRGKRIPDMSAVSTNGPTSDVVAPRHWYHLPPIAAPRQQPDLAIPRIAGGVVSPVWLVGREVLVDANFSTLWVAGGMTTPAAAYALLTSLPVRFQLEAFGTVMGGGALKVEARDVRRLRLPQATDGLVSALDGYGKILAKASGDARAEVVSLIDLAVIGGYGSECDSTGLAEAMTDECETRLALRGK